MAYRNWSKVDMGKIRNYYSDVTGKITLGIDGFIDEVWQLIETRKDHNEYSFYANMRDFGQLIVDRSGSGMAVEITRKRRSYGGFTANTGNAVASLGIDTTMIGMYGKTSIDSAFEQFSGKCMLISISDPAVSHILEFSDGKIMLAYLENVMYFSWDILMDALGLETLAQAYSGADIVSLSYWSALPEFDEILTNLHQKIFVTRKPKKMFFDLADLKKCSITALKDSLSLIASLNNDIPMILSLNDNEAAAVFSFYGEKLSDDAEAAESALVRLRQKIGIDEILVHTPFFAAIATASEGSASIPQMHCENAVKTTGAGDTFNGAYLTASLGSLGIIERIAAANAATHFWVSKGYAANKSELIDEAEYIYQALT